ncbi:hypothetical protein [Pseudomonas sp. MAG002Y]|uniref:hypothetical protein n=1 Tax=Pseudomonas sp. MAG002Y TaxID=2678690 RepID=UPI001C610C95|nr:hypothetical protein [Pseudomonas sp. MAG002Y]MBW5416396.1 hypothetical protein [Pseudomonas sp. MAG002Y]
MNGLTRENSSTIAFVVNCYFSDAINTEELQQWAFMVMESAESYPDYIAELSNFDAPRFHIYNSIGFSPGRSFTKQEDEAIFGIAYLRNREVFDGPSRHRALNSLHDNHAILTEFRNYFPFIQVEV